MSYRLLVSKPNLNTVKYYRAVIQVDETIWKVYIVMYF